MSAILARLPVRGFALAWLTLALGLLGCQSTSTVRAPVRATGQLQQILDRGSLRVGVSADLPPLNMKNRGGEIIGFEIDVVRALADAMGLEVRFVEKPFADLLPTLEKGGVDMVISGLTITPDRNARVAFAGPYFVSGTSVVSRSEAIALAQSPEELDAPGRSFAALEGSTSEAFVEGHLPGSKLVPTESYAAAVDMVIDGRVDALVADYQICMLAMWRNPEAGLSAMTNPLTVEPLGIALPADAPLFLNLVTNYLNTLERTGLLTQFKARWLSDGSWLSELP